MKAQTMLITLILVILVVIGTIAVLLSTASVFRGEDYLKIHTTSLVTSLLRTDSGYAGDVEKCKTIAEILYCSQTTPSWRCGDTKCEDIADTLPDLYIQKALDPKLDYSFKYGEKTTALSKNFSNRTTGA
ncbi:MAG TPA: hypothetical protein VJB06_00200, partial [archaeon]|nr:hypothetical protein [archaeon]